MKFYDSPLFSCLLLGEQSKSDLSAYPLICVHESKKLATWKDKNGLLWRLEKLFMIIKGYFREPKVPFLSTG